MLKFNFYGHACFQLDDGKFKLLFDPFLTGNPSATRQLKLMKLRQIIFWSLTRTATTSATLTKL